MILLKFTVTFHYLAALAKSYDIFQALLIVYVI